LTADYLGERRAFERFDLKLPARIEVLDRTGRWGDEVLNLWTQNVCAGGAFFLGRNLALKRAHHVHVNMVLDLKTSIDRLRAKSVIKISGMICRLESRGIAVRFNRRYEIRALES
jgi:hypothetical protein